MRSALAFRGAAVWLPTATGRAVLRDEPTDGTR